MARRVCRFFIIVYLLLYLAALGAAFVGTRGIFGFAPDGLSAVYLVILGFPWTFVLAAISVPEALGRIVIGGAPLLNALIAWILCPSRKTRH